MKWRVKVFPFLVLFSGIVFSQNETGARQSALAGSTYAQADDIFTVFFNPAGISQINADEIGVFYSPAPFGLKELSTKAFAAGYNFGFLSAAFGAEIYGFELFREMSFRIGAAKSVYKDFSAGIVFDARNVKIKNYGEKFAFAIDAGVLYALSSQMKVSGSVKNIFMASYTGEENEIPTEFAVGLNYSPSKFASVNLAFIKEAGYPVSVRCGAEYELMKHFILRLGAKNEPKIYAAGIGVKYGSFRFDYAAIVHQTLPLTHQAGIVFSY